MDSNFFPLRGKSAASLFEALEVPPRHELVLSGMLHRPHQSELRTEVIKHIYGHQRERAEEVQWLALRIDPVDLGRMIFDGHRPASGEPSWREAGAIAAELLVDDLRTLIQELDGHTDREKRIMIDTINVSIALCGPRFSATTSVRASDARFSFLRISWLGTPEQPVSKPVPQTALLNALLDGVLKSRDFILDLATQRFKPSDDLMRETYLLGFSPEELEIAGLNKEDLLHQHQLATDPNIPDVISIDRELFQGFAAPQTPVESMDETEEPDEVDTLEDIIAPTPDVLELRQSLSKHGLNFGNGPRTLEEFDHPSHNFIVDSYEGMKAVLLLNPLNIGTDIKAHISYTEKQLMEFFATSASDIQSDFSLRINRISSPNGRQTLYVELDITMPEYSATSKDARFERLIVFFGLCVEHRDWFDFSRTV
jgi:hypothetical protein